jgi:hypothetical protein
VLPKDEPLIPLVPITPLKGAVIFLDCNDAIHLLFLLLYLFQLEQAVHFSSI